MNRFTTLLLWVVASAFTGVAIAKQTSPPSDDSRTICTITINSDNEKKLFQKHLPERAGYRYIELVPPLKSGEDLARGDSWFEDACESGIQCDVLLISGHFAGTFMGSSQRSLDLGTLERHSCSQDCAGLLRSPKEVFLMGCNTLAGKERDSRSDEEYLRALLQHGMSRDFAERQVQARYGAMDSSNRERMRRVFNEVPHIYGFDAVGPSGKTVESFLNKYLKDVGSYRKHLEDVELRDVVGRVNKTLQNLNQPAAIRPNKVLQRAMTGTAFTQTSGLTPCDLGYAENKAACQLFGDELSDSEKLSLVNELLTSKNPAENIATVIEFFNRYNFFEKLDQPSMTWFRQSLAFKNMGNSLRKNIPLLTYAPELQSDLIDFGEKAGLISKNESRKYLAAILQPLMSPPLTVEKRDRFYSIVQHLQTDRELWNSVKIPNEFFTTKTGIRMLGCTRGNQETFDRLVKGVETSLSGELKQEALRALYGMAFSVSNGRRRWESLNSSSGIALDESKLRFSALCPL